ncbi:MAG: motif protein [Lacunisphaera sp.]|nr:motif protein [Lacunisphaera sp.]
MKTLRPFLLICTLALAAGVSAQTITGYGVIKTLYVTQTTSGAPGITDAQPYALNAYVFGSGLTSGYTFTPFGGSAVGLTVSGGNSASFDSSSYATAGDLNTAYAEGVYSMTFPNGQVAQGANLPNFAGDLYPTFADATIGGTWSGNRLQVNNAGNYTLTFNFSSMTADDSLSINIRNSSDVTVYSNFANFGSNTNTFVINSGTLAAGQTYYAELRFNNNFINYNTPFSVANGDVGFTTSNNFEIQAIPEPSTYAAILGTVALAGVMIQRRRQTA